MTRAQAPMSAWLSDQVHDAVVAAQRLHARGVQEVWLHYRRGEVLVSEERQLEGYEREGLSVPTGKSKAELTEWIRERLRRVQSCP